MSSPHETTHQLRSASTAVDVLEDLVEQAGQVMGRISQLYGILAARSDPEGEAELELAHLIEVRAELSAALGRATLQVLAAGGKVEATMGATPLARPVPGPAVTERRVVTTAPTELVTSAPTVARRSVSPASLVALTQGGMQPRWSQTPERDPDERKEILLARAAEIGQPRTMTSQDDCAAGVQRLAVAVTQMDSWLEQPQDAQKALMGLASSLARQIQDESGFSLAFVDDEALRSAFSKMTAWSREHRPGFVPGLSRSNMPDHGSWLDDGRHWWRELHQGLPPEKRPGTPEHALAELDQMLKEGVDDKKNFVARVRQAVEEGISQSDPRLISLLTPHQSMLRGARSLKTLKTALRDALKAEEVSDEEASEEEPAIADDWPLLQLTEGKRAVILGGDPRPKALARMEAAFRFSEAEWEETDVRRVRALAERIRKGNVDLVILLRRYISHRVHDLIRPATEEADVPVCVVDTGYGVTQVKLSMERYFAARIGEE